MIAKALERRPSRAGLGYSLTVVGLSLFAGLALERKPTLVLALLLGGFGLLVLAFAADHPRAFFCLSAATLAFVPIYASPHAYNVAVEPTAALLWVLGLGMLLQLHRNPVRLGLSAVDVAALLFFCFLVLSLFARARSFSDLFDTALIWFGPYLGVRLLVARIGALFLVRTVAVSGLALLPFVFYESSTGKNVFSGLVLDPTSAAVWLQSSSRLGHARPSASFGHPLALSIFLATATALCVALCLDVRERSRAKWWLAGACLLAVGMALTLSRTGWVVLAATLGLLAVRRVGFLSSGRIAAVIGVAVVLLVLLPEAKPAREIVASMVSSPSPSASNLTANRDYRLQLLREAVEPGVLKAFGSKQRAIEGSVDNEYLYLADEWGIVSLAGFVLLVLLVGRTAIRTRGHPATLAIPAVTAGNLVGLAFVALITQQQILVWMLLGATAAVAAHAVKEEKLS